MIGQLGRHPYDDLIDFGVVERPALKNGQRKGGRSYLRLKGPPAFLQLYFEKLSVVPVWFQRWLLVMLSETATFASDWVSSFTFRVMSHSPVIGPCSLKTNCSHRLHCLIIQKCILLLLDQGWCLSDVMCFQVHSHNWPHIPVKTWGCRWLSDAPDDLPSPW